MQLDTSAPKLFFSTRILSQRLLHGFLISRNIFEQIGTLAPSRNQRASTMLQPLHACSCAPLQIRGFIGCFARARTWHAQICCFSTSCGSYGEHKYRKWNYCIAQFQHVVSFPMAKAKQSKLLSAVFITLALSTSSSIPLWPRHKACDI